MARSLAFTAATAPAKVNAMLQTYINGKPAPTTPAVGSNLVPRDPWDAVPDSAGTGGLPFFPWGRVPDGCIVTMRLLGDAVPGGESRYALVSFPAACETDPAGLAGDFLVSVSSKRLAAQLKMLRPRVGETIEVTVNGPAGVDRTFSVARA